MKASFIIAFASPRLDNLRQTLRFLQRYHATIIGHCELITVCQDICDLEPVVGFGEHRHYNLEVECMQLPRLTNFGVDHCNGKKVIVLESDRILPPGYFAEIVGELRNGVQITTAMTWKLSRPYSDEEITNHQFEYNEDARTEANEIGKRNMWSGNTAFMKADFENAGKMDEGYRGYGWADSDMTNTMVMAGIKSVFRPEIELHLWHPGFTYGQGDQEKMFVDNGVRYCRKWNVPIPEFLRAGIAKYNRVIL